MKKIGGNHKSLLTEEVGNTLSNRKYFLCFLYIKEILFTRKYKYCVDHLALLQYTIYVVTVKLNIYLGY